MRRSSKLHFIGTFSVLVLSFMLLAGCAKVEVPKNDFFPFNNAMRLQNAPKTIPEQAALLKELGFPGIEGYGPATHSEWKKTLNANGLKMQTNYTGLTLGGMTSEYLESVKTMISATSKGEVIEFYTRVDKSVKGSPEEIEKQFVAVLKDLAVHAKPYGVKLGVYPHVGNFCETVEHSVQMAKAVNEPNYGAIINLCHMLKVEGSEGVKEKIDMAFPYLVTVSISGADDGDTKKMAWDKLIQPLGKGSFDVYGFLAHLWDKGYSGPVGLQCYNVKGDVREVLKQSQAAWNEYKAMYVAEKKKGFTLPPHVYTLF